MESIMKSLLALWTILSIQAHLAHGFPLEGMTTPTITTVGWVSDAPNRGTLSIITSCILTMGLCVWSALHLNIPLKGQGPLHFWVRNVKWMLMGLFGPELVVFAAWKQYVSARTLQDKINGLIISETKLSTCPVSVEKQPPVSQAVISCDSPDWTIVHSFYAGMGGFVFDLNPASASALLPSNIPSGRLTLTPRGIALLAECGLLPRISSEDIGDKSKADDLAKALVCLQASWMVIQVVGRVAYSLPVTLLEINTIGHVVCAFVIYVLWWHKPKLIREPTILSGEWTEAMCAYMWMSSRMSDPSTDNMPIFGRQGMPELAKLVFYPYRPATDTQSSSGLEPTREPSDDSGKSNARVSAAPVADTDDSSFLAPGSFACIKGFGYLEPKARGRSTESIQVAGKQPSGAPPPPPEQDAPPKRWRLALEAMQSFPAIYKWREADTDESRFEAGYQLNTEELVCERAGNWPSNGLLNNFRGLIMGMALWFATIAFGAVHAAAWKEYFPSLLERWLWRSCSVYIMASGFIWLSINFLARVSPVIDDFWEGMLAKRASRSSYVVIGFLCTVCGLAYGFARIFLIIEAVISLRRLPASAYNTPDWSQLIPHL